MNDYKEYLNIAILQGSKPVTYKSLARSLGIHVNTAKQVLYEFSDENQATVHAVYCITGTSIKNDQFSIQLVKASELEETKKSYKQITGVHVYSVTSFEPNDFALLYSACKDIPKLSLEDRIKCGVLKNDTVILKRPAPELKKPAPVVTGNPFAKAAPSKPTASAAKPAASAAKPAASAAKSAALPTPVAPVKRKGTLSFEPATSKKQAVTSTKSKAEEKNKPLPKSVVDSKKKGKNDHDYIEKKMAKTSINKNIQIFSSDEEDDDDEEEEKEEKMDEPQEEEPLELGDEDEVMEDAVESKESKAPEKEEEEEEEEDDDDFMDAPSPKPAAAPGKIRRKVLKKKTARNARGHLVTESYYDYETDEEAEVKDTKPALPPPKPKATAASSTTTKSTSNKNAKKPAGQQTNLFSFFKKN